MALNSNTFNYVNYKPIPEFSDAYLSTEDALAALLALILGLEAARPGTIKYLLTRLSLIDGGFRFQSSVSEAASEKAMQSQREFWDVLRDLIVGDPGNYGSYSNVNTQERTREHL